MQKNLQIFSKYHLKIKQIVFNGAEKCELQVKTGILRQLLKIMIMSCNQNHLWKQYDKEYIKPIAGIFEVRIETIDLWTKYEPKQAIVNSYINQEVIQLHEDLRNIQSPYDQNSELPQNDKDAILLLGIQIIYMKI